MELSKFLTRFDTNTKIRIFGNLSSDVIFDGTILKFVNDEDLMEKYKDDTVYMARCNISNDLLFISLER